MSVYVGRWDCSRCGHKAILGPETECPNCGADRPKDVQFYMLNSAERVQDQQQLQNARAGADWRCSYCTQNNPATVTVCKDCGNTRTKDDTELTTREYSNSEIPNTGKKARPVERAAAPPPKSKKKGRYKILLVALLVIGVMVYFTRSKEIVVTVESFGWERTIETEVHRLVEEEDWSVPSGGTRLQSFRAIHHYDKILDHYETRTRTQQRATGTEEYACGKRDLGNGYFEDKYCTRTIYESYEEQYEEPIYRKEPVYQTKYRYSVYRWQKDAPLFIKSNDHQPRWPNSSAVQQDRRRRLANRSGKYSIIVRDDLGEEHEHTIPFDKWEALEKGQQIKAKRGAATGKYRGLAREYRVS